MRRPLVLVGTKARMLAPASEAVAVGARVVQAVAAASEACATYGVCAVMIELGVVAKIYTP